MAEFTSITRGKKRASDSDEEIDFSKPTGVAKIGHHLLLICGLIVLTGGLDIAFSGSGSSGWLPGEQSGGGRQGFTNGPTAIVLD